MLKIYGPYLNCQGRKHIILVDPASNVKRTTQYARWLIELKVGRQLINDETVDHIDGDFTNDSISNLQILSRSDNIRKSLPKTKAEIVSFRCPICNCVAHKDARKVRWNKKQGKAGPFCGRVCAGRFSTSENGVTAATVDSNPTV